MHTSARLIRRSGSQSNSQLLRLLVAGGALLANATGGFSQEASPGATTEKKEESPVSAEVTEPAPGTIPSSPIVAPDIIELEALKVNSGTVKNSMVTDRKNANVSVDLLTTQDFGKFVGTDIADLVIRIPGLSTSSQGTFAVVRGLSERYNPVMLDGIVLPSSDPERQSPELDIFPARLVDAIVISKTYDAALPGTSSGACIDLRTKPLPEGRTAQIQFGIRADEGYFNDETFVGSDTGGRHDYFGMGVKDRQKNPLIEDLNDGATKYLNSPATINETRLKNFPLGGRFSLSLEDRIVLNEENGRALGYVFSLGYDMSASSEEGQTLKMTQSQFTYRPLQTAAEYRIADYVESEIETRLGVFSSIGLAFNPEHQVALNFFWSQIGLDGAARKSNDLVIGARYGDVEKIRNQVATEPQNLGGNVVLYGPFGSEEIYYRERRMYDLSLKGEHRAPNGIGPLQEPKVAWSVARINAKQDEPEYMISPYSYSYQPSNTDVTIDYGGSLTSLDKYYRFWRGTVEDTWAGRLDADGKLYVGPFDGVELRAGYYGEHTKRDYQEGAFTFTFGQFTGPTYSDAIKGLSSLGPTPFEGEASADRRLEAFYLSTTVPLVRQSSRVHKLDLVLGVRQEDFRMVSSGTGAIGNENSGGFYINYYNETKQIAKGQAVARNPEGPFLGLIDEKKTLPSIGINYSPVKELTVRLAYSKTVARPSFREVGSYFTNDRIADEFVHGNKDLTTSDVRNYDMRVEYFFPRSKDLIAFSLFKKEITRPIERISVTYGQLGGPVSSFANNPNDAELRGLEFEVAKKLGFLGAAGEMFTVGGNMTLIHAEVLRDKNFELFGTQSTVATRTRPLYDQPESIANGYVTFDHRPLDLSATISYFKISDVLQKVNQQYPDTYVASHDRWDFSLSKRLGSSWQVRFSARNLEDPERKLIYDRNVTPTEIILRKFHDGRNYTLSGVYDF